MASPIDSARWTTTAGGILGGEKQDWAGRGDRKPPRGRRAGGDGDGEFEGEGALAGLGGAAAEEAG